MCTTYTLYCTPSWLHSYIDNSVDACYNAVRMEIGQDLTVRWGAFFPSSTDVCEY